MTVDGSRSIMSGESGEKGMSIRIAKRIRKVVTVSLVLPTPVTCIELEFRH